MLKDNNSDNWLLGQSLKEAELTTALGNCRNFEKLAEIDNWIACQNHILTFYRTNSEGKRIDENGKTSLDNFIINCIYYISDAAEKILGKIKDNHQDNYLNLEKCLFEKLYKRKQKLLSFLAEPPNPIEFAELTEFHQTLVNHLQKEEVNNRISKKAIQIRTEIKNKAVSQDKQPLKYKDLSNPAKALTKYIEVKLNLITEPRTTTIRKNEWTQDVSKYYGSLKNSKGFNPCNSYSLEDKHFKVVKSYFQNNQDALSLLNELTQTYLKY